MNILILIVGIILIIVSIVLSIVKNITTAKDSQKRNNYYDYEFSNKKKNKNKDSDDTANSERESKKKKNPVSILGIILGIVLIILSQSFVILPTGYTGVKICFGQIADKTVSTGLNFKKPFIEKVEKVNNKQQDLSFDDEIWSETSERTALYYKDVTITYQINPQKSSWIYANVTNYKENLLNRNLVASAVKSSSKTLKDVDATNRSIVEPLIAKQIQQSVETKYGSEVVYILKVTVNNIDFEESYNTAIAEKQKAQIEAERQAIENQKKIDKAKADAEASEIQAKAEAKANELRQESLSDEILRNRAIEKWDGVLPKACGQDLNFILDLFSDNETANQKK